MDLRTNAVRLLEKKYEIDGRKQTYLGSRILGCRAGLSPREKLSAIQAVAGEVNQQFYGNTGVDEPELAMVCARNFMRPARRKNPGRASRTPFPCRRSATSCTAICPTRGRLSPKLWPSMISRWTSRCPFRPRRCAVWKAEPAQRGRREIKVPVNVYRDESALEFIRNPDGSMSLLIKNIIV